MWLFPLHCIPSRFFIPSIFFAAQSSFYSGTFSFFFPPIASFWGSKRSINDGRWNVDSIRSPVSKCDGRWLKIRARRLIGNRLDDLLLLLLDSITYSNRYKKTGVWCARKKQIDWIIEAISKAMISLKKYKAEKVAIAGGRIGKRAAEIITIITVVIIRTKCEREGGRDAFVFRSYRAGHQRRRAKRWEIGLFPDHIGKCDSVVRASGLSVVDVMNALAATRKKIKKTSRYNKLPRLIE